jgi:general secretion pathway protein L
MSANQIELLRLVLPPARNQGAGPICCAWRCTTGLWHSAQCQGLDEVAKRYPARRLEVCPHPGDISMTEVELPPLSPKRLRLAVQGAVELLALHPPEALAIGFCQRSSIGKLPMAWMSAATLTQLLRMLQQHGLRADAVLPPPAFLPVPSCDVQAYAATALRLDDWLVLRTGPHTGVLQPCPSQCSTAEQIEPRLHALLADAGPVQWLDACATTEPGHSTLWNGSDWPWSLPSAHDLLIAGSRPLPRRWLGPAWIWGGVVLAVWLAGLQLRVQNLAEQGQALKRQMSAQVKAAFPELPIVLQPLQQARQLRDARRAGTATTATPELGTLLRAATALLTQSAAQVQRLDYRNGQLEIRWREGAELTASELATLQAQARDKGLVLSADAHSLRLWAGTASSAVANTKGSAP